MEYIFLPKVFEHFQNINKNGKIEAHIHYDVCPRSPGSLMSGRLVLGWSSSCPFGPHTLLDSRPLPSLG